MGLLIDFDKLKELIIAAPEIEPYLNDKSEGFVYLYKNVYIPLLNSSNSNNEAMITANTDCYEFDDLVDFDDFIKERYYEYNAPILLASNIFKRLMPITKLTAYI